MQTPDNLNWHIGVVICIIVINIWLTYTLISDLSERSFLAMMLSIPLAALYLALDYYLSDSFDFRSIEIGLLLFSVGSLFLYHVVLPPLL